MATVKKAAVKKRPARTSRRTRKAPVQRNRGESAAARFFLPVFLSFCLVICLIAIGLLGYRSVTASSFFDVDSIEVNGVQRSSKPEIERIVRTATERSGTWNADLADIRSRVEAVTFVRAAAVSRILPHGLRVEVFEKEPEAIVKMSTGSFLVDADGRVIAPAGDNEDLPFAMAGWDETHTETAPKQNIERLKMYRKMIDEWHRDNLLNRVLSVDLSDIRDPRAIIEDSKERVSIAVGRDQFYTNLKNGISAVAGKGDNFEAVELVGTNMRLASRKKAPAADPKAKQVKNQ